MDPYLEDDRFWPSFQHKLMNCLYQILIHGLVDRYRAHIRWRHYLTQQELPISAIPGEQHEVYIEIRQRTDDRLITLLDVVSPANKLTPAGRKAYLDKRGEGRASNSNLIEIDLLLQGQPMLDYSREGLPHWDYAVTVTRATQPDRYEIYTATLQKRLPRFRVPLAADDRDTVLDLPAAAARAYEQGDFGTQIDYQHEPPIKLSDEDRKWLDELLVGQGLRMRRSFSRQEIAEAAYFIWRAQGRPEGRAEEHWRLAEEQLSHKAEDWEWSTARWLPCL
jgi:hypothetical protein